MNPRGNDSLPRIARWTILVALVISLGVIAYNLVFKRGGLPPAAPERTLVEPRKVDRKEDVQHLEFKAGTAWLDVRGDTFYLGEDGLNHLEGRVRIVDRSTGRGDEMTITADSVAFDTDLALFTFSGTVVIREAEAILVSPFFEYEKDAGLVRSDRGVTFTSPRLAGEAGAFRHDLKRDILSLSGGFRLKISPTPDLPAGILATGLDFLYEKAGRKGRAGGGVSVDGKSFRGASRALEFRLDDNEQALEFMALTGRANCEFQSAEAGGDETEFQKVEADDIRIVTRRGSSDIQELEARGGSVLSVMFPVRRRARISGETVGLNLDQDGRLRNLLASGRSRLDWTTGAGGPTSITGSNISYERSSGILEAGGNEESAVVVETLRSRIEAGSIRFRVDADELAAAGGVRGVLRPDGEKPPIGFFASGEPVFFVCLELAQGEPTGRLTLSGGVRVWQEDEFIETGEFGFYEESGSVMGRDGVASSVRHAPAGRPPETFVIRADRMEFDPERQVVLYEGNCEARREKVTLSSKSLQIALGPNAREVKNVTARDDVIIRQGPMDGRGGEAFYDLTSETIVLLGRPVLLEPGRGSVRGDKLTFRLADDRILIENKGKERSVAVVKS